MSDPDQNEPSSQLGCKQGEVWCLFDSGATNSCDHPGEVSHLAVKRETLQEKFDLVTENCVTELQLVRSEFKVNNNFTFQTISSPEVSQKQTDFDIIRVPERFQKLYDLEATVRVQSTNHPLILGFDQIMNFPRLLDIDEESGVMVARSGIDGQILVARTGSSVTRSQVLPSEDGCVDKDRDFSSSPPQSPRKVSPPLPLPACAP